MSEQRPARDTAGAEDRLDGRGGERRPPEEPTAEADRVPSWLATAAAWAWRLLLVLAVTGALLFLARRLTLVTLSVFLALVLSTLCVPVARWLETRGAPRALAAGIVVVGGLAVAGGVIAAFVPAFSEQVEALVPTVRDGADRFIAAVEASPLDYDRDEIADLVQQLTQRAGGAENGDEIAGQVAAGAILLVELVTGLVLSLVVLFFLVKDGEQIVAWGLARTPPLYRDVVRATGRRAWLALSAFIRGTLFIATVDATLIGIGLALLRVPLVLPLALLVFVGAFVPVIGAFVSGLVAVLVALAAGGPLTALFVLLVVVGVQQVEGQILQPVLLRRAVALHPAVVLLAITAGAVLAGLAGAFLAVPLSAVASSVANELRLRHERHGGDVTAGGAEPLGPEREGYTPPAPTVLERRREQR